LNGTGIFEPGPRRKDSAVDARGVEPEAPAAVAHPGLPLFWGHGLLCCMAQEDAAEILPWTGLGAVARLIRWGARGTAHRV
jgi:hypothetical protein